MIKGNNFDTLLKLFLSAVIMQPNGRVYEMLGVAELRLYPPLKTTCGTNCYLTDTAPIFYTRCWALGLF
jgi:hypothetical protein